MVSQEKINKRQAMGHLRVFTSLLGGKWQQKKGHKVSYFLGL